MMEFPIQDLLDEAACYTFLVRQLHPGGLHCPEGHLVPVEQAPHMKDRAPVVEYRCRHCRRVFNAFTGTLWQQTHYRCSTIVLILRGFAQGTPTAHLARELAIDRGTLLNYRHHLQAQLVAAPPPEALTDLVVEADELYQNAGEKGQVHANPTDPPRRRANKRRGQGTYATSHPFWASLDAPVATFA